MYGGAGGGGGVVKALLRQTNFTLGPNATLITEIHKNSFRLKAPNSVSASKRNHENLISHCDKQRRLKHTFESRAIGVRITGVLL